MTQKFILTHDGEKVKLYKGKIRFKDRHKVIPGLPSLSIQLRNELKKLKPEKVDYKKLKQK